MADSQQKLPTTLRKHFSFQNRAAQKFFQRCRPLIKTADVTVLLGKDTGLAFGKILIVASRQVGAACKRNRLRRLTKAIFLEQRFELLQSNLCIIFKPKCRLARLELENIFRSISAQLNRVEPDTHNSL
jgi:ribonuclease P protein component